MPIRAEGGPEHLGGEVLSVGAAPDPCVHQPVEAPDSVPIDRLPVGLDVGVNQPQLSRPRPAGQVADRQALGAADGHGTSS